MIRRIPNISTKLARKVFLFAMLVLLSTDLAAQTSILRGFVTHASNGEALQGVNVVLDNDTGIFRGAVSNGDGVWVISRVEPGPYSLRVSFVGYETYSVAIDVRGEDMIINIELNTEASNMEEVTVESERITSAASQTAGLQTIRAADIDVVPSVDVSGDLASYLTTLPGVVSIGDRGGQLYIRGGEPSHNMILLDGIYVYQPFHLLGFYSAFPSDIINRADIYAAGHSSRFTGRISSVIDIYSRNGNLRNYEGSASISPFVSSLKAEGPIVKDKVSFLASARQSFIEQGAAKYVDQSLPFNFGDSFAKLHYVVTPNHRVSITGLRTHDRGVIGEPTEDQVLDEVRWNNTALGIRYIFLPKQIPFVGEIVLSKSTYESELGPREQPVRKVIVSNLSYTVNITNFVGTAEWHWGFFWRPPEIKSALGGLFQGVEFGFGRRHKAGVYVEPDFYITPNWHVQVGFVGQLFPGQDDPSFIEPRFKTVFQKGRHEFSAAAGVYHQDMFGLNDRRDANNVYTTYRSAPNTDLTTAYHALAGYRLAASDNFEFSAEAYYKDLNNLYIGEWTSFPRFTSRLQLADGSISGLDVRAEFQISKLYGFINYGLSKVLYTAKQASIPLWYGVEELEFSPPHDRRHQFNTLVATSLFGFDLSARWNFGSGRPFNRVFGFDGFVLLDGVVDIFNVEDEQRVIYEEPYQGVLPTYHRLDISVDRTWETKNAKVTAQASVINVYNRRNIFALDIFTQKRTDQLPFLPTAGLKIELN